MTPTSTGTHHEIESKLDADANFVLPDLTGLPGVGEVTDVEVQDLEAVYLDSADLRLARHGTTFRRRTGGPDAGWHLKLPAARKGRIEVRHDLDDGDRVAPPELIGLVRVQLRGEPVAPVARITTRRTVRRLLAAEGGVLAEIADDQVTAEALGSVLTVSRWREIEVELVDGDDALLASASAMLIEAGARSSDSASKLARALATRLGPAARPDSAANGTSKGKKGKKRTTKKSAPTAGEIVVGYLHEQVEALIAEDPRVRISADDAVHQMRVATRRLRTALATFRPLFTDRAGEPLRAELAWLGGVLGVARDAEVMRAGLTRHLAAQPAELVLGPVQRRIDLELGQTYQEGHANIVTALDGERYLALIAALEEFVARPPLGEAGATAAATELRTRVRHACRRVQKAQAGLVALGDDPDVTARDEHLHEIRIAAKRARYAGEVVQPVFGKQAKTLAAAMEAVQETLGDHQDAVVERQWLRDLGIRAFLAGENGFTFGRLHGLADARAQHDEAQFAEVWKATRTVVAAWPG